MKRKIELYMTLLLLIGLIIASKKLSVMVASKTVESVERLVVIDAGHGGKDPGKVGVNGVLEKDINLQIANKVKKCLENENIEVLMTRTDDTMQDSKLTDMKQRVQTINDAKPMAVVSIHQNSYSDASVHGAQVFYFKHSKDGEQMANMMQTQLKQLDANNTREMKANETFYMLKKTNVPTIIVECGFLSNPSEAEKLVTEEYQEQMAQAICQGIIKWLDK